MLEQKIRSGRLRAIFISHLHGDHYFGLFGLLNSLSLSGRTEELLLFAPKGLDELLTTVFRSSQTVLSYPLHFHTIDTETHYQIWSNGYLSVETIPLQHRVPCSGFVFREKNRERKLDKSKLLPIMSFEQLRLLKEGKDVLDHGGSLLYRSSDFTLAPVHCRSYAYCSDTSFVPTIIPLISGVDLLYHEATFLDPLVERARKTFHSTANQAAEIALQAGVSRLLIGHLSTRYPDSTASLEEARQLFPNTYFASEGTTWIVGNK